jgi:hypothetical protein
MRFMALSFAPLALASGACVSVEADVDEMQVTRHALSFEGTTPGLPEVHSSVEGGFSHPRFPLDVPDGFAADIRATRVGLLPTEGSPDLDFIQALELTLSKEGQSSEAITLLSYRRPAGIPAERDLVMPVHDSPNVADLWKTSQSVYALTVVGVLPEKTWAIDVTVSFTAQFDYQP